MPRFLVTGLMGTRLTLLPVDSIWAAHEAAAGMLSDGLTAIHIYELRELG